MSFHKIGIEVWMNAVYHLYYSLMQVPFDGGLVVFAFADGLY